jgi:biopolymer transport protein ExbB/TolQ|tara:strand:+ start:6555 stop:7478 length:924 start_codon:yes stop_codon:yes gene_type:complete
MFLTILTFLSAISISVIAAGYSIIGLATLFAGAVIPIIAMGSALEVGKLVAASWLYHNWNSDVPRLLKGYLFGAIIILIFITSMGIFGFLSKAHLDQVRPTSSNNIKIELLDKQINQQNLIIDRAEKSLSLLDKALEVYIDKEYVTRGLKERKKQKEERDSLNTAINEASDQVANLTNKKAELELSQDKIEAEVGPIKYVAELIYGENAEDNFDHAVRIVILILIFVFDPLAVLLLIAANISLRQWKAHKNLTNKNTKDNNWLQKKIEKLNKRNKKLKKYETIIKPLGDDPDEIKLRVNQIVDLENK